MDRRNLLKFSGAMSLVPFFHSNVVSGATTSSSLLNEHVLVDFSSDGRLLSPLQYCKLLQKLVEQNPQVADRYGAGGAVETLEKKIAEVTGKESTLFMPSGTLANQLAIKVLSKNKNKVFVQEQSHVYRDESDAAQRIHGKRLMPLASGKANFTLKDLTDAIEHYRRNEVFKTEIGAISIENTVRRRNEEIFDVDEIAKISKFARSQDIGMHLDGARLYMASIWSGVSIRQYSSYFDTVYISLYKYLGAGAGAVLAGDKKTIATVKRWMKPFGASMYQNWHNALVALHFLDGFEARMRKAKLRSAELFKQLNKIDGLTVETFKRGSNTAKLTVTNIDPRKLRSSLLKNHRIRIRPPRSDRSITLKVNETLLNMAVDKIASAFKDAASS